MFGLSPVIKLCIRHPSKKERNPWFGSSGRAAALGFPQRAPVPLNVRGRRLVSLPRGVMAKGIPRVCQGELVARLASSDRQSLLSPSDWHKHVQSREVASCESQLSFERLFESVDT